MPRFQVNRSKCREIIEKGRRKNWWRRRGSRSKGFRYSDAEEKPIEDAETLERIESLVIPPAWKMVRISPHPGGKLQALGMDTSGRVQYIYHPEFIRKQKLKKFAKIERFGSRLPALKEQTNKDITREGLPREKVLAVMLRLINVLYFRIGTDASAKNYRTFGITTLRHDHLHIGKNGHLRFEFTGKSHVKQRMILVDKGIAEIMRELKKIGPKKRLFQFVDEDGKTRAVKPTDINDYIKSVVGDEFSSKDLRTWGASLSCAIKLAELGPPENEKRAKENIVETIKIVAEELGNTPTVCRSSYIHPAIIEAYEAGVTLKRFHRRAERKITGIQKVRDPEEGALVKLFAYKSK